MWVRISLKVGHLNVREHLILVKLTSENVLTHYTLKKPTYVTCDASSFGVGRVLSRKIDGHDRPIMFASNTLSANEKKYYSLERKALAIIFAVNKFHKYFYGRKFILITDHQPLQFIFGKNKGITTSAAATITRWAITLLGYMFDFQCKKGSSISNADGLPRLPRDNKTDISDFIYSFNLVNKTPFSSINIAKETAKNLT